MNKVYFSHDSNARNNKKIIQLRLKYGWEGYGLFWAINESLFEAEGYLKIDAIPALQMVLNTKIDLGEMIRYCTSIDLYSIKDDFFYSESLLKRINQIGEKSKKAKDSARKRWEPMQTRLDLNANAMRTQCDRNASKVNKSKVNESKDLKSISSEVEKIYESYPKKIGRQIALKSIESCLKRNKKTLTPLKLLEFTQEYAKAISWKDPKYIPNPSTWFNQDRFADDRRQWQRPRSEMTNFERFISDTEEIFNQGDQDGSQKTIIPINR